VVTKDIPANSVAVRNPCRVLQTIEERDMQYYYKDRAITQEDLAAEASLR
jgi:maltose O-acetyltransferase